VVVISEKLKYVGIAILLFDRLEYLWVPWEKVPIYFDVPFVYKSGPIRLDALVYAASVKVQHVLLVLIVHILLPFRNVSKYMIIAFSLAFFELFLTWNEPVATIPLPFNGWIPISIATVKFCTVCWFMWACVMKAIR
jgi:hypothetical protein